jgi:hypothetical protein
MLWRARLGYNLPTMISISSQLKEKTKTIRLITAHLLTLAHLTMAHLVALARLIMAHLITESPTTHPITTNRT